MFSQAIGPVIQQSPHLQRSAAVLALAGLFTFACVGAIEPLPDATKALMITVSTAGVELDADGYIVTIDSEPLQAVDVNAVVTVALPLGKHVVRLNGLSPNCYITGRNDRSVQLVNKASASPVTVSFSLLCVATPTPGPWAPGPWDY